MSKKPKISPDDLEAFQKAMTGIKPLVHKKVREPRAQPIPKQIKSSKVDATPLVFHESLIIDPVQGEEYIDFKQPGISNKTLRKLRKGQYNVEAKLDLHGMSVDESMVAVDHFLQESMRRELRVVLIVHGKGHHSEMPILKNKINHWLREINIVLAFCSAAPLHGSRGAIYVMLKKQGIEESSD